MMEVLRSETIREIVSIKTVGRVELEDSELIRMLNLREREVHVISEWIKGKSLREIGSTMIATGSGSRAISIKISDWRTGTSRVIHRKAWRSGDVGIGPERVRQILATSIRKLRHPSRRVRFKCERLNRKIESEV